MVTFPLWQHEWLLYCLLPNHCYHTRALTLPLQNNHTSPCHFHYLSNTRAHEHDFCADRASSIWLYSQNKKGSQWSTKWWWLSSSSLQTSLVFHCHLENISCFQLEEVETHSFSLVVCGAHHMTVCLWTIWEGTIKTGAITNINLLGWKMYLSVILVIMEHLYVYKIFLCNSFPTTLHIIYFC